MICDVKVETGDLLTVGKDTLLLERVADNFSRRASDLPLGQPGFASLSPRRRVTDLMLSRCTATYVEQPVYPPCGFAHRFASFVLAVSAIFAAKCQPGLRLAPTLQPNFVVSWWIRLRRRTAHVMASDNMQYARALQVSKVHTEGVKDARNSSNERPQSNHLACEFTNNMA